MTSCLVTGAAGFVGSHLVERLLREGHIVLGVDSFTDYYPRKYKMANLASVRKNPRFTLAEMDVNSVKLRRLLRGTQYVFHLAAQPGVRPSWGSSFDRYVKDNIMATQALLEACRGTGVSRLVYASSSSIYGDAESLPTSEDATPQPMSPYGATKLAGEHLCRLYWKSFGVPTVTLRYFTVYGPRQRPDMAFSRFIDRISRGTEVEVYGDGRQRRDFTYIDDTVGATVLAMEAEPGSLYNVGSGGTVELREAIAVLEDVLGRKARVERVGAAAGDVKNTSADISRLEKDLGYRPRVKVEEGLRRQAEWQLDMTRR